MGKSAQKSYSELLKDPRWQRKRLEILQRSDFSCETCSETERTLHVHHKTYRTGAMPWEYDDSELESICERCHQRTHDLRNSLKRSIARMDLGDLERVVGYVDALLLQSDWDDHTLYDFKGSIVRSEGAFDAVHYDPMGPEKLISEFPSGATVLQMSSFAKKLAGGK